MSENHIEDFLENEINATILQTYSGEFGMSDVSGMTGRITAEEVLHHTSTGRSFTEQQMRDMIQACWIETASYEFTLIPGNEIDRSSPLRDEEDTDTMGAGTDPMAVGEAEKWFRNIRGDDQSQPDNCPDEGECPPVCDAYMTCQGDD